MLTNATNEERDAIEWALELALDDQQHYLDYGNPQLDYGKDWPEIASDRAKHCRAIADTYWNHGSARVWNMLADQYDAAAEEVQP
jgi:hypothetical protein